MLRRPIGYIDTFESFFCWLSFFFFFITEPSTLCGINVRSAVPALALSFSILPGNRANDRSPQQNSRPSTVGRAIYWQCVFFFFFFCDHNETRDWRRIRVVERIFQIKVWNPVIMVDTVLTFLCYSTHLSVDSFVNWDWSSFWYTVCNESFTLYNNEMEDPERFWKIWIYSMRVIGDV